MRLPPPLTDLIGVPLEMPRLAVLTSDFDFFFLVGSCGFADLDLGAALLDFLLEDTRRARSVAAEPEVPKPLASQALRRISAWDGILFFGGGCKNLSFFGSECASRPPSSRNAPCVESPRCIDVATASGYFTAGVSVNHKIGRDMLVNVVPKSTRMKEKTTILHVRRCPCFTRGHAARRWSSLL